MVRKVNFKVELSRQAILIACDLARDTAVLEVEEVEATHRRATAKARALPNRKSPRTLTPVPSSAPSLLLTLPQTPAPASWARLPAPGSIPAPGGTPVPGPVVALPPPTLDAGWRRTELLHPSGDRSLSSSKAR